MHRKSRETKIFEDIGIKMCRARIRSISLIVVLFFLFSSCNGTRKPDSIILFIGDGMGWNHLAYDFYKTGDDIYERFGTVGVVHVEPEGTRLTSESASSATALATGQRVPRGVISIDSNNNPLKTVLEKAKARGKSVGVVVTSSVTHATPAAFLAHVPKRYQENEIAIQISSSGADVIMGGGRRFFTNNSKTDEDLLEKMIRAGYESVQTKAELDLLDCNGTEKVIGLFADEGMEDARLRAITLSSMVGKALCILEKNPAGFFLMVEGSQIDWRSHENDKAGLIAEMKDFQSAVEVAFDFQKRKPSTLIVETADHETGGLILRELPPHYREIKPAFLSKEHTTSFVPLFARGPGEEKFSGFKHISDIGKILINMIE